MRRPGRARASSAADAADGRLVRHGDEPLAEGRDRAYEKDLIQDALKTSRGNRAKAARLLNTTGRIMNYKVRQLSIDWRRFKK